MISTRARILASGILLTLAGTASAQSYPYLPQPQQGVVWQGNVPIPMPYPMPMPQGYPPGMPQQAYPPGAMPQQAYPPGAMPMPQGYPGMPPQAYMMPGGRPPMMMPAGPMMMPNGMPQMMPGAMMPQGRVMMPMPQGPAAMQQGRPVQAIPTGSSPGQMFTNADAAPAEKKPAEPAKDGAASACDDKKPACCDPCRNCGRRWTVFGDALWLKRNDSERVFLGQLIDGATTVLTDFTTDRTDFSYSPGFRVGLAYHLDDSRSIEALYFGLNHWSESSVLLGDQVTNSISSPFLGVLGVGIGTPADFLAFNYSSDLHNIEVNYRRGLGNNLWQTSVLGGFRFLSIDEEFSLSTANTLFLNAESTNVETTNSLVGGQLGGEIARPIGERATLSLQGKAGIFMNFASQQTTNIQDAFGAGAQLRLDANASDVSIANILEIGVRLSYRIGSDVLLRVGYDVFFINGLALAPEQLGGTNTDLATGFITPGRTGDSINDNGSMILHGPFVGVEY